METNYGGGHYICDKCGETVSGSALHHCQIEHPKKYSVIYADPAWRFSQGINRRSAIREKHGTNEELSLQYPTMADDEITNLNVGSIADDNCVLFLWTTDAHLEVAIKALNNWGFKYKTVAFTWNKKRGFMGKWTVKQCEICLLATKGTAHKLLKSFKEKSYLEEEKTKHSKKPNEFRLRIERMFGDVPKVELFAREKHSGWDTWGNEVKNDFVLDVKGAFLNQIFVLDTPNEEAHTPHCSKPMLADEVYQHSFEKLNDIKHSGYCGKCGKIEANFFR